jgi:ectoine hydroxylase-related dioxygenase (phytanoyl-CoA dioxygenase family)
MVKISNIPERSYGILDQNKIETTLDVVVEQVRNLGYAILESGYSVEEIHGISDEFDRTLQHYVETYGESRLRGLNENYTIRSPLAHGGNQFRKLALNDGLIAVLRDLIPGKFILNQQNGVINPPQETYNQGAWHRDLPYQHFVSSKPLAVNALFCVDDFTFENGATFVLPASHKSEAFPSENYINKNAIQVEAKAGSFILLDCMLFHAGGFNNSHSVRRAVNHVYTIPYFKQQIKIPNIINDSDLSSEEKDIFGFGYIEPCSIAEYLSVREGKEY